MSPGTSSTTFWDEQTLHRRAARGWTAVFALVVLALGLPLAIAITPVAVLFVVLLLRIVDLVLPVPAAVWEGIAELPSAAPSFAEALLAPAGSELVASAPPFWWLAVLLAPGFVVMGILWWIVRRLSLRTGAGGLLLDAGVREPVTDVAEERRLVNVVEEMAVAAGEPPPRVLILDQAIPNAAVVGRSVDDAAVVVTRGLLERLDRDETQAVVGHLLAHVAAGDLRLGISYLAVVQAVGIALTAGDALLLCSRSAARELADMARWAASEGDDETARRIASRLAKRIGKTPEDGWPARVRAGSWGALLLLPLLPAVLLHFAFRVEAILLRGLLIEPLVAMVLRRRRYLADSLAAQLTRNPAALGRALAAIDGGGGLPVVLARVEHLFLVGRAATPRHAGWKHRVHPAPEDRRERLKRMAFESDGSPKRPRRSLRYVFSGPWQRRDVFLVPLLPLLAVGLLVAGGVLVWMIAFVLVFATGIALAVASASLWLIVKLFVP